MSSCEPSWRPAGPRNRENLPAHFLLPVPAKQKRSLRRTILIYRWMMSYPLAVPRSSAVHHPQTSQKLNLEKRRLADLAGPSVSQGVGCGENPAGTNDSQRQLTNMCLTGLGASPYQYHPCTRLSGRPRTANDFFLCRSVTTGHALYSP